MELSKYIEQESRRKLGTPKPTADEKLSIAWEKIRSDASSITATKRAEFLRLQALNDATKNQRENGPLHSSKRSAKSRAKGTGQILKNSHIASISLENPPLRGNYATVNKPKEHKDVDKEIQSAAFEKPKSARTLANGTIEIGPATKNWPSLCVEIPWDEGKDDFKFTVRIKQL